MTLRGSDRRWWRRGRALAAAMVLAALVTPAGLAAPPPAVAADPPVPVPVPPSAPAVAWHRGFPVTAGTVVTPRQISADGAGGTIALYYVSGSMVLRPGDPPIEASPYAYLLVRWAADGSMAWVHRIQPGNFSRVDLAVSAGGEAVVAAEFTAGLRVDDVVVEAQPVGAPVAGGLVAFDRAGARTWTRMFAGTHTGLDLETDAAGDLLLTASVLADSDLGRAGGANDQGPVVARVDRGGVLRWAAAVAASPGTTVQAVWAGPDDVAVVVTPQFPGSGYPPTVRAVDGPWVISTYRDHSQVLVAMVGADGARRGRSVFMLAGGADGAGANAEVFLTQAKGAGAAGGLVLAVQASGHPELVRWQGEAIVPPGAEDGGAIVLRVGVDGGAGWARLVHVLPVQHTGASALAVGDDGSAFVGLAADGDQAQSVVDIVGGPAGDARRVPMTTSAWLGLMLAPDGRVRWVDVPGVRIDAAAIGPDGTVMAAGYNSGSAVDLGHDPDRVIPQYGDVVWRYGDHPLPVCSPDLHVEVAPASAGIRWGDRLPVTVAVTDRSASCAAQDVGPPVDHPAAVPARRGDRGDLRAARAPGGLDHRDGAHGAEPG